MSDYDQIYWDKILSFTSQYFNVQIPKFPRPKTPAKKKSLSLSKDFSEEYEFILKTNCKIGQKFIQLLHDYRFDKVNSANLEIDQLYYPQKLYNYLRNHHWKKGIPHDFVFKWVQSMKTNSHSNDHDLLAFQTIFDNLNVPFANILEVRKEDNRSNKTSDKSFESNMNTNNEILIKYNKIIPPVENFQEFKHWLLNKLDELEKIMRF